jgi:hypothetical protein
MPKLAALAISVGVLAVVATWLFLDVELSKTYNLQVWQAFIAWGCHFQSGGKITGSRTAFVGMSFGAIVGLGAMTLAPHLPIGDWAAPVAVGLGATLIVLASTVPWLAVIPASVYGFAAIAGLALLTKGMAPMDALLPTIISVLIGAAFGYVSEMVADALAKKDVESLAAGRAV